MLGLLLVVSLGLAAGALAAPIATYRARAIPIPGFPGTGDLPGAGAEVEARVTISGTEYAGFPSPLTGINVYTPAGLTVNPTGFVTCAPSALENIGPAGCPAKSQAGPLGEGQGDVAFGQEVVPENVSIQSFFDQGGLVFYVNGTSPVSLQFIESARWARASAPFGQELLITVPLVETLPGAPDASVTAFKVKVGAAYKKGNRTISYITQPNRCPKGGYPTKMELLFLSGEAVTIDTTAPCPRA